MDLRNFKVSRHDHSDHCFREVKEVRIVEDGKGPGGENFRMARENFRKLDLVSMKARIMLTSSLAEQ